MLSTLSLKSKKKHQYNNIEKITDFPLICSFHCESHEFNLFFFFLLFSLCSCRSLLKYLKALFFFPVDVQSKLCQTDLLLLEVDLQKLCLTLLPSAGCDAVLCLKEKNSVDGTLMFWLSEQYCTDPASHTVLPV